MKPGDVHRTKPESAVLHTSGWVRLDDQWDVTALPLVDVEVDDAVVFARLTYADALRAAKVHGAELIHPEHVELLHQLAQLGAAIEVPAYTGTPTAEKTFEHSLRHDAACLAALAEMGGLAPSGLGEPVANIGKHWVHGAPAGRSWLMGWHVPDVARYGSSRRGPGFVQGRPAPGSRGPHDDQHHDDGTTTMLVRRRGPQKGDGTGALRQGVSAIESAARAAAAWLAGVLGGGGQREEQDLGSKDEKPGRRTIRRGDVGRDVAAWQSIVGVDPDAAFGASTEAATRAWQDTHGLVADGVVGRRSWEAAGERFEAAVWRANDPRAPACVAALRDANAAWPTRKKASDGIMGDARHQASKSDHNAGNAVDVSHDPASGCDAGKLAELAIHDPRVTYVIWDRRIYSRARSSEGWRPYSGANPHTKHVHISVRDDARDDASPWPWAP